VFDDLERINLRPKAFEFYTASDLWTDAHTSGKMLSFHLNQEIDVASRRAAFIDRSVEWIASRFNVGAGTKIADFGCGPGLYALQLAGKQADVVGIDFSKTSLDYARQAAAEEGLSIRYIDRDYLQFETDDRFHLSDFCALSPDQRKRMLTKFGTLLAPGGAVLLDVYSLNAFSQRAETAIYEANLLDGFWSPDKYYGFLNTFKYEQENVVLDKYTIVDAGRTREVYNWLQCFSPEDLKNEFAQCGLEAAAVYGDVAGAPYDPQATEFAVVAQKVQQADD